MTGTLYGTGATFGDTTVDVATVTIEGGQAGILDIWRNGTNASYQAIRFRDDTNANTEASIGWASNQLRLNGTSTIVATTGSAERMRINSSGNVGIGETSPQAKLDIYDTFTKTAANPNTVEVFHTGSVSTNNIYPVAGLFTQRVSGSANVFATGLVGVAEKLGDYGYIARGVQGIGKLSGNITINNADMQYMGVEGRIEMEGSNSVNLDDRAYSFYGTAEIDSGSHLKEYHGLYLNTPTNNGTILNKYGVSQVDANSKNYFAGNVGIGTDSPSFGTGGGLQITNATQANLRFTDTSASTFITDLALSNDDFYIINRAASGQLKFRVNASNEAMTIDSSGNVGIGNTSPNGKLTVKSSGFGTAYNDYDSIYIDNGDVTAGEDNYGNGIGFSRLGSQTYKKAAIVPVQGTSDTDNLGLAFFTSPSGGFADAVTEAMRVDYNGNVGIGTTSPSSPLHVSSSNNNLATFESTDGISEIRIKDNSKYTRLLTVGSDFKIMPNDGVEMAVFEGDTGNSYFNGGNVGIGTTSPSDKLDVNGRVVANAFRTDVNTGDYSVISRSSAGNAPLYVQSADSNTNQPIAKFFYGNASPNQGALVLNVGKDISYFTNTNLGIGTTSPGNKLEVVGSNAVRIHDGTDQGSIFFRGDRDDVYIKESGYQLLFGAPSGMLFELDTNNNDSDVFNVMHRGSSRMYINGATGNVGINNTSPVNGKLVVNSDTDGLLNTVRIVHTRSDSNFGSKALEVDVNLSGADTTTADRTNRGIFVDLDSSADGDAANEHRIHGIESDVRFTGFSDIARAGYFHAESLNITEKTAQLAGVYAQAVHDAGNAAGGVSNMYGVFGYSSIQDLGDVDNAFGVYGLVNIGGDRGNADVGVTKAVEGEISIGKATTISYGTMIGISSIIDNNQGTVPNFGNQYLFKGDYQGTKGSNAYGIYCDGDKHYLEGNVGIGTTSPSVQLDIEDSSNVIVDMNTTTANANTTIRLQESGTVKATIGYDGTNNGLILTTGGFTAGNGIFIDDTQKVGIGTTSPGHKLEVYATGDSLSIGDNSNTQTYMRFANSRTMVGYGGANAVIQAGSGKGINFNVNNDSFNSGTAATITSSGNVGIGTTSPTEKLEVDGRIKLQTSAGSLTMKETGSGSVALASSATIVMEAPSNFRLNTGPSLVENFTVLSTGNVGMGTASPASKFEVYGGNTGVNDVDRYIRFKASNGEKRFDFYVGGTGNASILGMYTLDGTTKTVQIAAGGTSYFNAGNVGIGTTAPTTKLNVSGSIAVSSGSYLSFIDSNLNYNKIGRNTSVGGIQITTGGNATMNLLDNGNVGIGTTSPNLKLDVISGTNNGIRISATDTTSNWRDIDIRSYVSQAQANALPDGSAIYTTNPTSQTETAFSKFGGLVLQGRDDGNSSFAIRLGNGNGYATRMFMGATGATVFSNTVTATNFILSSDERLKENVKKVCDNRVKADWKTFELKADKGQKRYGVIAQELEKTNPEFVREDSQGFKSVAYIDLLIAKIAELEARLEKLEK